MSTKTRARIVCLITALFLVLPLAPAGAARAATSPPSGLTATGVSKTSIAVSWKAVAGVPRYRIQYSTSSSMSGAKYLRFTSTNAEIGGLSPGKTYYLKVRAITASGGNLSPYSKAIKVKTSTTYSFLSPKGFAVTGTTADSISLAWTSRGTDIRYRVSWATSSSFGDAKYLRITDPSARITGLAPGQKYYLKVRVITNDGVNLSSYSPSITGTTAKTTAPPPPSTGEWGFEAPGRLKVAAGARTAVALSWSPVAGAERYRIQYSASASMSAATYVRVSGSTAEISGLTAGRAYYFKIRVITPDGVNLSPYSAAVTTTTPTGAGASYLAPAGPTAAASGSNKLSVAWKSRGSGLTYEVVYADNSGLDDASSVITTSTKATLSGLDAETTYYAKVRVIAVSGDTRSARSAYTAVVSARTTESVPSTLRVASYNIKCANCYSAVPNEGTWYERRDAVVDTVLAQKLDVIGFQEASQGWLKDSAGKLINLSQFEDLVNRLGSPYKLANTHRNNCVKSTTPTNCVYKDQGASQGTKIIYNSSSLTLIDQGSTKLSEVTSADNDRFVAWAVLEQKSSGKRFLFADVHLDHKVDAANKYHAIRIKQTKEVASVVKAKSNGLPTYVVGDFNSNKWTVPNNGPYDVLIDAGFVDPLGNTYRSTTTAPGATVERRIRTNFSSYNDYLRKPPSFTYLNGTYIDYIWTSRGIKVPEWETVVNLDAAGNFIGIIPSDHNLLRATTSLP